MKTTGPPSTMPTNYPTALPSPLPTNIDTCDDEWKGRQQTLMVAVLVTDIIILFLFMVAAATLLWRAVSELKRQVGAGGNCALRDRERERDRSQGAVV